MTLQIKKELFENIEKQFPELTRLILNSTSLWYIDYIDNPDEKTFTKEYWLLKLNSMTTYQLWVFRRVLEDERSKLNLLLTNAFKDNFVITWER